MNGEIIENKKCRTEKRAPEGSWGFLVGIGLAVTIVIILIAFISIQLIQFRKKLTNKI